MGFRFSALSAAPSSSSRPGEVSPGGFSLETVFVQLAKYFLGYQGQTRPKDPHAWDDANTQFPALHYKVETVQHPVGPDAGSTGSYYARLVLPDDKNACKRVWVMVGGNGSHSYDWVDWIKSYLKAHPNSSDGFICLDFPGRICCQFLFFKMFNGLA